MKDKKKLERIIEMVLHGKNYAEIIAKVGGSTRNIKEAKTEIMRRDAKRLAYEARATTLRPKPTTPRPKTTIIRPKTVVIDMDEFCLWVKSLDASKFFGNRKTMINRIQKHGSCAWIEGVLELRLLFLKHQRDNHGKKETL